MLALKAWYCDNTHRYAMTDAVQPLIVRSAKARKPAGDPKADLKRYFMLAHGSHLVDTARFLAGPLVEVDARLKERFGAYCWFVDVGFEPAIGVPPQAHVLVHQIWLGKKRKNALDSSYSAEELNLVQRDIGRLAQYTVEMGGGIDLLETALRIPPWEPLSALSKEEIERMRLNTIATLFDHEPPTTSSIPPAAATLATVGHPAPRRD